MKNYWIYILKAQNKQDYLSSKLSSLENKHYGDGNSYSYCPCCEKSIIQISIDSQKPEYLNGHDKNCLKTKLEISKKNVTSDLNKNIKRFMKNNSFNHKSFLNYAFLIKGTHNKNNIYVSQLIEKVNSFLNHNPDVNCEMFNFYGLRK